MKELPFPGSLYAWMNPPLCFTIPYTDDNPKPVPSPAGFVVKNGSNTFSRVSLSIPVPVSDTVNWA